MNTVMKGGVVIGSTYKIKGPTCRSPVGWNDDMTKCIGHIFIVNDVRVAIPGTFYVYYNGWNYDVRWLEPV